MDHLWMSQLPAMERKGHSSALLFQHFNGNKSWQTFLNKGRTFKLVEAERKLGLAATIVPVVTNLNRHCVEKTEYKQNLRHERKANADKDKTREYANNLRQKLDKGGCIKMTQSTIAPEICDSSKHSTRVQFTFIYFVYLCNLILVVHESGRWALEMMA
ncbi:hypothetical protein HUJ04_001748 [Dendroctonus ponderosae]|nr:hypothetical protein HUJ04_001748 [Dendroctonus ponderosae]